MNKSFMLEKEKLMEFRQERLVDVCQKYNLTTKKLWVKKFSYILCLNDFQVFYYLEKTKTKTKKVKLFTGGKTKLGKAGHRERIDH